MTVAVITNAAVMVAIFSKIANRLAGWVAFQAAVMALAADPSRVTACLATMTTTVTSAMPPAVATAISATMATTVLGISGRHGEQRSRCQHQYTGHDSHEIFFL
ncbi:hypothetical protein BK635_21755 [Pseudomonas chlororaphis]|nr:hypothetical protein BK635_21755 [Pseudomonas chlororaphis]